MKKRFLALALVASMCVSLAACGNSGSKGTTGAAESSSAAASETTASGQTEAEGDPVKGGTLTISLSASPSKLDPIHYSGVYESQIIKNVCDTLIDYNKDLSEYVPSLATDWTVSDDGMTYVFNIRQGVKFHDGSDLTVEDVKWSLDRAIASNYVNYIVNFIESVEITGDNTIVIHCAEPYAPILNNLSMPFSAIVPKAYIEANGDEYFSQHPIGSGPYKMVEWNPSDSVKLEAFDEYFMGKPATKNLVMKVIPEAAQRVIALEMGEVDIAYSIEANDVSKIDANPDLVKYSRPSMTCFNYFFNLIDEDRPTYDLKVRQAICYAIDRQKIIDTILQGSATLADSMIAPIVACYTPTPTYDYDLEKAKQLMAESSYPNGCDLIMVTNQSQQRLEICQVVQQMLKELNINVEIRTYEQATYIQALNEHEHDMGFSAWITSTGDADYTYYPCYHSTQKGKPGNRSFFDNPKADELIEKGRSLSDPEARKEVYSELNQIIYENCTQLFICHPLTVEACTKYVEGFVSNKDGYNRLWTVKCLQS